MKLERADVVTAVVFGLIVAWVSLASFVIIDDQIQRRRMAGRWAQFDQDLADAQENAAARGLRERAEDQPA